MKRIDYAKVGAECINKTLWTLWLNICGGSILMPGQPELGRLPPIILTCDFISYFCTNKINCGAADVHEKCEPQVSWRYGVRFLRVKRKLGVGFRGVFSLFLSELVLSAVEGDKQRKKNE
jgi:hypothetical protein